MAKLPRATLKEVAKVAGVSSMTVSRVLNGSREVTESLRLRVREACQKLDYVVQPQVSAAMRFVRMKGLGAYNGNLGYLQLYPFKDYRNPAPTIYVKEMRARAAELGYGVEVLHAAEPGMNGSRLSRVLQNRGVRGVIVGPLPVAVGHLSLNWDDFALVTIGWSLRRPELHRISSDLARGMSLVCHNLRKLGYRRIAFVSSKHYDQRGNYLLLSGFSGWHALFYPGAPLLTWIWSKWDAPAFLRWFRKTRPDCIVSSPKAEPFHCLREAGVDIPGEVGFASVGTEFTPFPVSGLDQRQEEFGAAAVDKVIGLLSTGSFGLPVSPHTTLLEGVWQGGPTTRNVRPAATAPA